LTQNEAYITFATNAPGYGPLVSSSVIRQMQSTWSGSNGCEAQEKACYAAGTSSSSDTTCSNADNYCVRIIGSWILSTFCLRKSQQASLLGLAAGNRDVYDLRQGSDAPFPPEYYTTYLSQPSVTNAIGAMSQYTECANAPYDNFAKTGDVRFSQFVLLYSDCLDD